MNSLEKVQAFKDAMVVDTEEYDGVLGIVQGLVSAEAAGFPGPKLTDGLPDTSEEFDEALLEVAGFVLWLRSDDAPKADADELVNKMPEQIAQIAAAAGIA